MKSARVISIPALLLSGACGTSVDGSGSDARVVDVRAFDASTDSMALDVPDAAADALPDAGTTDAGPPFVDAVSLRDGPPGNRPDAAMLVRQPRASCPTGDEPHCGVVRVPGGAFVMGGGERGTSQPAFGPVQVSPFRLDQHEVTVARFRRWVDAGMPRVRYPLRYPGGRTITWRADAQAPELPRPFDNGQMRVTWTFAPGPFEAHPVNNLTVATAQSFCAWDGGRLPTEAQWEWVAFRYGTVERVRTFPHGDAESCDAAVYGQLDTCPIPKEQVPGPVAVGSRPPEGLFFDLGGNVREFTADIAFFYSEFNRRTTCRDGYDGLDPLCVDGTTADNYVAPRPQVRGASYIDPRPSTRDDRITSCCIAPASEEFLRSLARYASPQVGFRCAYED